MGKMYAIQSSFVFAVASYSTRSASRGKTERGADDDLDGLMHENLTLMPSRLSQEEYSMR